MRNPLNLSTNILLFGSLAWGVSGIVAAEEAIVIAADEPAVIVVDEPVIEESPEAAKEPPMSTAKMLLGDALIVKQQGDVRYVSGGVSDEEQQAIKDLGEDFDLKLTFSTEEGKYLSDVNVLIKDAQDNTVLETVTDGPLLYTNLTPGTYTVEASGFGQQFQKQAQVKDNQQEQLIFRWDSSTVPQ